ncbi:putative transposase [Paenibacillus wynnii]|nr:putative transposase [Paenibacillus wynnii]
MKTQKTEIESLIEAMRKTQNKRLYERYQAVCLHLEGRKTKDICAIIKRNRQTIERYIHVFKQHGVEGLVPKHSPGKPHKLKPDQEKQLAEMISSKQPVDVGFEAQYNWTLRLVVRYIHREFGQSFTLRGASKVLHYLGFSYTKPTYTLARADLDKQNAFKEDIFPALKKSPK